MITTQHISHYKDGSKEGSEHIFYKSGVLESLHNNKVNERCGYQYEYWENGNRKSERCYNNEGIRLYKQYHSNGNITEIQNLNPQQNFLLHGTIITYHQNGVIKHIIHYRKGVIYGKEIYYDESGKEIRIKNGNSRYKKRTT